MPSAESRSKTRPELISLTFVRPINKEPRPFGRGSWLLRDVSVGRGRLDSQRQLKSPALDVRIVPERIALEPLHALLHFLLGLEDVILLLGPSIVLLLRTTSSLRDRLVIEILGHRVQGGPGGTADSGILLSS